MTEIFHVFQAGAFIDYSSKFRIEDKDTFLSILNGWADSKEFLPEDKSVILEFVNKYYEEKCKEEEIRKNKKSVKQNNKIFENNDPRQFKFDFLK